MQFFNIVAKELEQMRGQIISVIGGGGKTSLLLQIGRELREGSLKVVLTSTTKISSFPEIPLVLLQANLAVEKELESALAEFGVALVADCPYKGNRLRGIDSHLVRSLLSYADVVLVESDGARQRSLKTHKEYEPVIPPKTSTVVIICGADAIGKPLDDESVHRAPLFAEKWGLNFGATLSPEIIAKELLSPRSYLREIPLQARLAFFLNKSDLNDTGGKLLANELKLRSHYPIFLGSLKQQSLEQIN